MYGGFPSSSEILIYVAAFETRRRCSKGLCLLMTKPVEERRSHIDAILLRLANELNLDIGDVSDVLP